MGRLKREKGNERRFVSTGIQVSEKKTRCQLYALCQNSVLPLVPVLLFWGYVKSIEGVLQSLLVV
jgi:hypothetical protein